MKNTGKPLEIITKLNEMAGYTPDEEIQLYEVCFPLFNFSFSFFS